MYQLKNVIGRSNAVKSPSTDFMTLEYAIQIISLGCFYLEYSDAIHEGDGIRVLRCWRYLLPIFWNSGRVNYSNEVLNMLFQHDYSLSPRHSMICCMRDLLMFMGVRGKIFQQISIWST